MLQEDVAERTFDAFDGLEFGLVPGSRPGDVLRRARETKGLSLADAARHTRIAARHLESIENADYRDFHARVYAVGFARTYARYLGLPDHGITAAVHAYYTEAGPPLRFDTAVEKPRRDTAAVKALVGALLALTLAVLALRLRG